MLDLAIISLYTRFGDREKGCVHVPTSLIDDIDAIIDLVQELYLKELRAYKPVPEPKDGHVGHVKEISMPKAPEVG